MEEEEQDFWVTAYEHFQDYRCHLAEEGKATRRKKRSRPKKRIVEDNFREAEGVRNITWVKVWIPAAPPRQERCRLGQRKDRLCPVPLRAQALLSQALCTRSRCMKWAALHIVACRRTVATLAAAADADLARHLLLKQKHAKPLRSVVAG